MEQIQSQRYQLHGVAISQQGGRPENQDDLGWIDTPLGFLLVVCDGMGGGPGGKTASYIAKNVFLREMLNSSPQASRIEALKKAISMANDALYAKMDAEPALRGMGSTLVAVLISEQSALVAHLGDSRCYKIRGSHILFRTKDHSLVGGLVQNKALTEEQARVSPQSNVIMRGLGNTSNHVPEIEELPFRKGDRFLLCTDGVWGIMPHEELAQRLTSQQNIASLASNLSAEVDQRGKTTGGHYDNHTLAVIELKMNSILKDKMDTKTKIIIGALSVLLLISLVFNFMKPAANNQQATIDELNTALTEKTNQLAELQSYQKLYNDMKETGSKELITRIEVLEYEKASLQEYIDGLMDKLDALEKKVEKESGNGSAGGASGASAQETAQRIVNRLEEMKNVTGTDLGKTVGKKAEIRNRIIGLLNELDEKTNQNYHPRIEGVARELKHPKSEALLVQRTEKKTYESTQTAIKKIDQLSSKIKEIKKQL